MVVKYNVNDELNKFHTLRPSNLQNQNIINNLKKDVKKQPMKIISKSN